MSPLIDSGIASIIQKDVDTTRLGKLCLASRDTFKTFRPWFMRRMITLFNLPHHRINAKILY